MLSKIKDIITYTILPLGGLFAWIWYLLTKNRILKSQVEDARIASEMKEIKTAAKEAVDHAKARKANLDTLVDEFKRDLGDGSER